MAKILQNVDPQTNMSGKEMAVNQVEKMLETGTMEDVHNEAGLWIDYRRNKEVMNDAVPSVPKDENLFDAVAIIKRKTDEYNLYYIYVVHLQDGLLSGQLCPAFPPGWKENEYRS